MRKYRRIEDMHPQIKTFFESVGKLELDDEETPEICFLKPHNGTPKHSIAISVAELRWLGGAEPSDVFRLLCENRPGDEWLYWGVNGWISEAEMLRIINLKSFL